MSSSKGKVFIIGSGKEVLINKESAESISPDEAVKTEYGICCENIAEWLLLAGYDIHLAGTVFPTADYFVINKIKKMYDSNAVQKNKGKVKLFLDTALKDDSLTIEDNKQLEYVEQMGFVISNQISDWGLVHDKVIKGVDLVVVLGGGTHSPNITEMALRNDKIIISITDFEDGESKKEQEVAYKHIGHYLRSVYGIGADVLDIFKKRYIYDAKNKSDFIKKIGSLIKACNRYSKKNQTYWVFYIVLLTCVSLLIFLPELMAVISNNSVTFFGNFSIYWTAVLAAISGSMFNYGWGKIKGNKRFDVAYLQDKVIDGCIIGIGFASVLTVFIQNFMINSTDVSREFILLYKTQGLSDRVLINIVDNLIKASNDNIIYKARFMVGTIGFFMGVSTEMSHVLLNLKSAFKL